MATVLSADSLVANCKNHEVQMKSVNC